MFLWAFCLTWGISEAASNPHPQAPPYPESGEGPTDPDLLSNQLNKVKVRQQNQNNGNKSPDTGHADPTSASVTSDSSSISSEEVAESGTTENPAQQVDTTLDLNLDQLLQDNHAVDLKVIVKNLLMQLKLSQTSQARTR